MTAVYKAVSKFRVIKTRSRNADPWSRYFFARKGDAYATAQSRTERVEPDKGRYRDSHYLRGRATHIRLLPDGKKLVHCRVTRSSGFTEVLILRPQHKNNQLEEKVWFMKKLIERQLGSLTFAAGQTSTLQLPRDYSLDRLSFLLAMTLYRAAGASAGAPKDLSGCQIIKKIEVRKNGRDVLKSIDFETLVRLNQIRYGTQPTYTRTLLTENGTAITTQWDAYAAVTTGANAVLFRILGHLDFGMWNSIRRNDTLLDCTARGNTSTLDLVITWGQYDDVMTSAYNPAAGGVAADSVPVVYVSTREYLDIDDASDPYKPYIENREYGLQQTVTATTSKFLVDLGVAGNMFRSFIIKTYADDVQVNTILNNIILRAGTDVYKNVKANQLRFDNKTELGVESMPTGYYLLEMCPDGHLAKAIDTSKLSSLMLELDVTLVGTISKIEVFPVELVAPVLRQQ